MRIYSDRFSWDAAYSREIINHEEDADDEGTIWFDESNAEDAILAQLGALEEDSLLSRSVAADGIDAQRAARFLDLGTGNGHLLFTLREQDEDGEWWQGEMVGVDYSEASVQLASRIATRKQTDSIRFEQWDLLADPAGDWLQDGFDVVLDKGTFDAISLMPHAEGSTHPCEVYRDKVLPLIKPGCFLLITSCNWTKREVLDWLAPDSGALSYYAEAKYPTFTFGGQTGQSIVTLLLRRTGRSIESR